MPTSLPLLARLSAFTTDPSGGNPAGVWIGEALPPDAEMQRIATEVGYSETAFVARVGERDYDERDWDVRYFSPEAEVSFCGHATIATGVLLGSLEGDGTFRLATAVGLVPVTTAHRDGVRVASLTSVPPMQKPAPLELMAECLAALRVDRDDLDPALPPVLAWAGAWHLVLALRRKGDLDALTYDFQRLKAAMLDADLTTVQIVWRESELVFHSRNPFPVGGVVEDPATGAAAAALGGYLRDAGLLDAPVSFLIRQGEAMGRPSRIEVQVPAEGGVTVTGSAVRLDSE